MGDGASRLVIIANRRVIIASSASRRVIIASIRVKTAIRRVIIASRRQSVVNIFSCLAAAAAGPEVLALPDRAGHLRGLRGPGHLHLLCHLCRGLLDQDPLPAGAGPVVGIYI